MRVSTPRLFDIRHMRPRRPVCTMLACVSPCVPGRGTNVRGGRCRSRVGEMLWIARTHTHGIAVVRARRRSTGAPKRPSGVGPARATVLREDLLFPAVARRLTHIYTYSLCNAAVQTCSNHRLARSEFVHGPNLVSEPF